MPIVSPILLIMVTMIFIGEWYGGVPPCWRLAALKPFNL